jgi:serine/threonine protein kinase
MDLEDINPEITLLPYQTWNSLSVNYFTLDVKGRKLLLKRFQFPSSSISYERELSSYFSLKDTGCLLKLLDSKKNSTFGQLLFDISGLRPINSIIKSLSNSTQKRLITNIVMSLDKLHKKQIVHRNLLPEHIFIDDYFNVKFGGLESSVSLKSLEDLYGVLLTEDLESSIFSEIMSPEVKDLTLGLPITTQVDIWALGWIVYEILTKPEPRLIRSRENLKLPNIYWNTFLDKVFVENPQKRATSQDLLCFLSCGEVKQEGMSLLNKLKTSTRSWVKKLTEDKDSSFSKIFIDRLLTKAKKKPKKIEKFFSSLFEIDLNRPKVCLKSLALLHLYMNQSGLIGNSLHCVSFIVKTESLWTNTLNEKLQKYFSSTSQDVILKYCSLLKTRHEFCSRFNVSWQEIETQDLEILGKILSFYKSINVFSCFLLSLADFPEIYKEILRNLIKEQENLNICIEQSLVQVFDSEMASEFSLSYEGFLSILHNFYLRYPLAPLNLPPLHSSRSRRTLPNSKKSGLEKSSKLSRSLILL